MYINIGLVVFNLIPAFPMDGGRVLRSLLSIKFSRKLATRIASLLGQIIAIVFVYYSLYGEESNIMLAVIGVFIFMTASAEYQSVKVTETLKEYTATNVMRTDVQRIPNHLIVQQALNYLIKEEHGDFILEDELKLFVRKIKEIYKNEILYFTNELKIKDINEIFKYVQIGLNGLYKNEKYRGCLITVMDISNQKEIQLKEQELNKLIVIPSRIIRKISFLWICFPLIIIGFKI